MVGRNPKLKIIQATHTGELSDPVSVEKSKHLIDSAEYNKIFHTKLTGRFKSCWADGKLLKAESTFAAGVGGAITGRGADLLIIDDPHSEQDALSDTKMESCL